MGVGSREMRAQRKKKTVREPKQNICPDDDIQYPPSNYDQNNTNHCLIIYLNMIKRNFNFWNGVCLDRPPIMKRSKFVFKTNTNGLS